MEGQEQMTRDVALRMILDAVERQRAMQARHLAYAQAAAAMREAQSK